MKFFLTIIGILAIVFALYSGYVGKNAVMYISFLTSVVFLFFANIDRVKGLKVTLKGFEAETRERVENAENEIKDLKRLTEEIRKEINNTPYFMHGRLPFWGQAILRYLYQGQILKVDEFKKDMSHLASDDEIDKTIAKLKNEYGWIEHKDNTLTFTLKGEEAVKSYIELTIVRAF